MPTSDAAANAALDREVTAGGSWWLGLATEAPDEHLTSVAEGPDVRVEIPRTAAFWEPAADRSVRPAADIPLGTASDDYTPVAWVLWDSEAGGTPHHSRRLTDTSISAGDAVTLPADTLSLIYP